MANPHNIIDFGASRQSIGGHRRIQIPQLVQSAHRTVKHYMREILPEFFTSLDDSLFGLSQKSDNHELQNQYFEVMRDVRLHAETMTATCLQRLDELLHESLCKPSVTQAQGTADLSSMSLMDEEQLEESLAISNMAAKADNQYRHDLHALAARINFLMEDIEVSKNNNPLRPAVICEAFNKSLDVLNTGLTVRLIILKLFDQYFIQHMDDMYVTVNEDLIAAGVLPRIKTTLKRSPDSGLPRAKPQTPRSGRSDFVEHNIAPRSSLEDGDIFESLQQMLSLQRSANDGRPAAPIDPAQALPTQAVVGALSSLQHNVDLPHYHDTTQSSANFIISSITEEIRKLSAELKGKQVNQTDTDTIDVVSMLFDFILDDPSLSDHIKVHIARLQIPMLKVAIMDKAFFATKSHPARQLLNELAYAGNDFIEEDHYEEDPTYKMIAYVVERILNEFNENMELFELLNEEFSQFVGDEREANRLAGEMMGQSKNQVANEIQRRLKSPDIPVIVRSILMGPWKEVLSHIHLRDGGRGTAWNTALAVADELIWSVQPKQAVNERQRLIKIIPRVLNGIRDGLTLIAYDRKRTDRIFAELEKLHIASLRGELSPAATTGPVDVDLILEGLDDDDFVSDDEFYGMTRGKKGDGVVAANELDDLSIEDVIRASEKAGGDDQASHYSPYAEVVRDMALGTWVEFKQNDGAQTVRGKLAWKCDFTGEYTFVDRKYQVVADIKRKDLMLELEQEKARIIEDVPLFDRALDAVIKGIQSTLKGGSRSSDPLTV